MSRIALLVLLTCVLFTLGPTPLTAQNRGAARPGFDAARASRIDTLIEEAIAAKSTPGAVVLVGRGDTVVYQKAFGHRALLPASEPMTLDTVFDMASLTKVVATTTAVMTLVEQGLVRLTDPVASLVPGFERHGKRNITVRHLLTHVSGLRPDVDLGDAWMGYEAAIELARAEVPTSAPGERFVYSDINFFLLGDIVARVTGQSLDRYTKQAIFDPLGMRDTTFNPPSSMHARIAPTERCANEDAWPCKRPDAAPLRGIVHDPTARRMGGVAGHAGLFSTAADISRFARMLLHGGELDGARVLSALAVQKMTSPATPAGMAAVRGLGWDIDSSYSSNRGELLPIGSFGHTGFTGTSLWVDPGTGIYVVFLSSRLHPDGTGDVTPLRGKVATAAAAAFTDLGRPAGMTSTMTGTDFGPSSDPARPIRAAASAPVLNGIDVLRRDGFSLLQGKRVGLVTNHTGRARDGASTIDALQKAPGVQLVALFSPEHGIRGILDASVPSSQDEKTGLPIHSLYGDTQRPTDAMLQGLDTMVLDLQDVGARFYTYQTTMAYVMEEAAKRKIAVVVLDRPNPINGWQIEGPAPDADAVSFIAYLQTMPVRHGMTMGELAKLFNDERKIGADLTVVPMANWRRDQWFDETGLTWVNPSPNMRNLTQATLYPGVGAIEYANVSVGRGTDQPFEQFGAPWMDGAAIAEALNARGLPGVRFYATSFTPASSKYAKELCQGVFMIVTNRGAIQSVRMGLEIAAALSRRHPNEFKLETSHRLLGSKEAFERVRQGEDPAAVAARWSAAEARWRAMRAKYLLYR